MATTTRAERKNTAGLSRDQLVGAYRTMLLSRRLDDKEIQLKRQNKIFFQISGAGHEAVLTAAGMVLQARRTTGSTCTTATARSASQLGMTPTEMLLRGGRRGEWIPNSGGRQMPSHWGHKKLNIVSALVADGHAVPAGGRLAPKRSLRAKLLGITEGFENDEVVFVLRPATARRARASSGSRSTPRANLKLPVVYLVEDNGYAISVPVEVNTAGGSISKLVSLVPGPATSKKSTAAICSRATTAMQRAVDYARAAEGPGARARARHPPVLALAVGRRGDVPSADGARGRRGARSGDALPEVARRARATRPRARSSTIQEEVDAIVLAATDDALAQPQPGPETVYYGVYSPDVDPTSEQFDTEDDPQFSGNETTMVDLLNACMKDEMRRDQKILVFGEDVADVSREQYLGKVKGKGGVFKVTWGLQKEFGGARVYNSPLAEANIVGRAIGLALRGFKPVVEIQFFDYIWPAYMQLRDELATMRWRSNNDFAAPVVVRVTYGGYIRGAIYHSQTGASLFTHCPGPARRLSGDRARRQRPAAHRDPLRRSGDLPRAQAPLPPDVQQGGVSRARTS